MAQVGVGCNSVGDFSSYPKVFVGGWGAGVDEGAVGCVPGGGCDIVSIGWTRVSMIYGAKGGVGGSRHHMGIPKVNPGRLIVAMIGLIRMPEGGKRKGIVCTRNEPQ